MSTYKIKAKIKCDRQDYFLTHTIEGERDIDEARSFKEVMDELLADMAESYPNICQHEITFKPKVSKKGK